MDKVIGDYRLIGEIGEGAAGKVYLATPTKKKAFADIGDPLAIKLYKETILKKKGQINRIEHEFYVGSTLTHPNLVRIHEWHAEDPNQPYLVMEYVDGMPLDKWVRMFHPLSERVLIRILNQLADGLAALHTAEIKHRDLKPENIMVSSGFEAKIMDFGVVRIQHDPGETPSKEFLGTIRNASPEWLRREEDKDDPRIDLYSFGTVLHCLLYGHQVFHEEEQFARLVDLVQNQMPEVDRSVEMKGGPFPTLCALAVTLLQKRPENRLPNVEALLAKLREAEELIPAGGTEPIYGYIASALTGVPDDARRAVDFESHMIANACKGFEIYLYQPRKASDPVINSDLKAEAVYEMDRKRVLGAGLLVVVADYPSYGVGQELEIAASAGTPTIIVGHEKAKPLSRMVTGSFLNLIETITFGTPEDLDRKIRMYLTRNVERVRAFKLSSQVNLPENLGARLREMRESVALKIEDASMTIGISVRLLRAIEETKTHYHNAGIHLIGRILAAYGRSPAELLDSKGTTATKQFYWDENLRNLEKAARMSLWPAVDYLELRDEYVRALATSAGAKIPVEEWIKRHQSLEAKRLKDAKAGEIPAKQQDLFHKP